MSDKYSFIVVKYPEKDTATAALHAVKHLSKEKVVKLKDAVTFSKNKKGKVKLHQTKDDTAGKGFLKGGLIGIIFGLLFGGAGWVAAGAVVGLFVGWNDRGILSGPERVWSHSDRSPGQSRTLPRTPSRWRR